jgi:hypothetical protein
MHGFRHSVETFFAKMHQLIILLTQHLSEHLRVPIDVLEDCFPDDGQFSSVLWHYFPFTPEIRNEAKDGFANGMHPHRDPSSFFNLLIQNRIGLQMRNHKGA